MTQELKNKWIQALKSGEYKFGKGKLYDRTTNCYCPLGVLAHILNLEFDADGIHILKDVGIPFLMYPSLNMLTEYEIDAIHHLNDTYSSKDFSSVIKYIKKIRPTK